MNLGNDNTPFYPEMGDDEALDKALKAMSSWSAPATKSKEEAWQQLMAGIDRPKEEPTEKPLAPVVTFRRRLVIYGSAAAALIVIILISTLLLKLTGTIQVVAPFGAFANVELPDRSSVVLNSDSKLTYSKIGWDMHRKVSLQGEAIFEVTTGAKFEVHTPVGYVRVLGTKFNVNFRNMNLEVDCLRGKVEVVLASGRKELLVAGQGLNVDNEQLVVKKELNLQTDAKWIEGEFYYREAPLYEVFGEIERQYNIRIQSMGISNRTYTGFFRKGNLKETLDLVCLPMSLTYSIQGRMVTIK